VLGFKLRAGTLIVEPVLAADWPGFELRFRYRSAAYLIKVQKDTSASVWIDDGLLAGNQIPLSDYGLLHHVTVRLSKALPGLSLQTDRKSAGPASEAPRLVHRIARS
jgi:cyclic beta-1,2-glucan synthetase